MSECELTQLINLVYRAVDRSVVGPVFVEGSEPRVGNTLAVRAFEVALMQLLPKGTLTVKEELPKECWE